MLQHETQRDSIFTLTLRPYRQDSPGHYTEYLTRNHYLPHKLYAANHTAGNPTGVALAWSIGIALWAYIFVRWLYRKRR